MKINSYKVPGVSTIGRWLRMLVATLTLIALTPPITQTQRLSGETLETSATQHQHRRYSAASLYATGLTRKVRVTAGGLGLETGMLIEDDSPASGSTHLPNAYDEVSGATWIRKELLIDAPKAFSAQLLFNASQPEGDRSAELIIDVNGRAMRFLDGPKQEDFYLLALPVEYLKAGTNIITFRAAAGPGWRFPISLDEEYAKGSREHSSAPGRSAKSKDGGASWTKQLGVKESVRGEYGVRIFVNQYAAAGTVISPVLDAESLAEPALLPRPIVVDSISAKPEAYLPPGASLRLEMRSGSTRFPRDETWSQWTVISPEKKAVTSLNGRFVQFQVELKTADPLVSPRLFALDVQSEWHAAPASGVYITRSDTQQIVESPIPFEYEAADLPALRRFRERHKLDAVVAGAQTEFERIVRLRNWVARQRNERELFRTEYPAWDADDILRQTSQGQCLIGHCMQYTIVFLQACRAFGIQGRHFSIDGFRQMAHEIAEVWSNDYRKWVYMDASLDCHYFDRATGTPLNLLELHRVFVETFYRDGESLLSVPLAEMKTRVKAVGKDVPIDCSEGGFSYGTPKASHEWWWEHGYLAAGFLRLTPRDTFLTAAAPVPFNQGNSGANWNGFVVWEDSRTPRLPVYSRYTDKASDLYWSLNQAQIGLTSGVEKGTLQVEMKNSMPFFEKYLVRRGGGDWQDVLSSFTWKLAVGINRLEVKPVDRMNREGITSLVELNYSF